MSFRNRGVPIDAFRAVVTTLALCAVWGPGAGLLRAQVPIRRGGAPPASNPATTRTPGMHPAGTSKAIWEPMPFPGDYTLTDVFFISPRVGWVTGYHSLGDNEGGFIAHTTDGGKTWTNQVGDPNSGTRGFSSVRFIDSKHGWATGFGVQILSTVDGGDTWARLPGGWYSPTEPYAFVSPSSGVYLEGAILRRTTDGGRSWKQVYSCQANVQVDGLAREEECKLEAVSFPTTTIGYASTNGLSDRSTGVLKTEDGGATWRMISTIPETQGGGSLAFIDERNGTLVASGGHVLRTVDGGLTWIPVMATVNGIPLVKFADPEVGWMIRGVETTFTYTTDGGKHWMAQNIHFPAFVNAFSLPRRDCGYVVGDHGMMYRYRIVPAEYAIPNMIAAPMMTPIDPALQSAVQKLSDQVQKLAADAGVAPAAFTQDTSAVFDASSPIMTNSAPPPPISTPAAGSVSATPAGAATGFVQDVGLASTTIDSAAVAAPSFVSRFRNLNLILVGLQVASRIPDQIAALKQSFVALKGIRDPQSAAAVIADLQAKLLNLRQMVRVAVQPQ